MALSEMVFVAIPFIAVLHGVIVGQGPCTAPQVLQLQLQLLPLRLRLQLPAALVAAVLSGTAFVPIPFIAVLNGAIAAPTPCTALLGSHPPLPPRHLLFLLHLPPPTSLPLIVVESNCVNVK